MADRTGRPAPSPPVKSIVNVVAAVGLIVGLVVLYVLVKPDSEEGSSLCPEPLARVAHEYERPGSDQGGINEMILLIDPASTNEPEAQLIVDDLMPLLEPFFLGNLRIQVIVNHGDNVITASPCLNGGLVFRALHVNEITQDQRVKDMGPALRSELLHVIRIKAVGDSGGPVPLLRYAYGAKGGDASTRTVVLWSDMLANDGSCLDGSPDNLGSISDGLTPYADEYLANQLVNRCVESGVLKPDGIDGSLVIIGSGETNRSGQFREFADSLASQLCQAIDVPCERL